MRGDFVIKNKRSVYIDEKVKIGKNVIIYENNRIEGNTIIEDNVTIFPNSFITNSIIGKGAKIYSSLIEKTEIGVCASIGPYSVLKNAKIEDYVKIGSFCEVKNAEVKKNEVLESFSSLIVDKKRTKRWLSDKRWRKRQANCLFLLKLKIISGIIFLCYQRRKNYDRHKFN